MEIHISIQTTEPLTGTATTGNEGPLHFEGWLELLHVISTLVQPGGEQGQPAKEGGTARRADPIHKEGAE